MRYEFGLKSGEEHPMSWWKHYVYKSQKFIYIYIYILAETLLDSLERAAAGIGLHVNAHKTEFMYFNQKGDISTLDGTSLKLGWQIHLPRKQRLINRKRHRHTANEGYGQLSIGFRSYGNQTWPIKWNAVSSRLRSCRCCCMDALLGYWLNDWRRS